MANSTCLATALRLLALRDLTEQQLRTKLASRQHPPDEIDRVVERLTSDGSLNDERLARRRAKADAERGRKGPHRVRRELEHAGIAASLAKSAVAEAFEQVESGVLLAALIDKRLGGKTRLDEPQYRKIYQFLLRRGFDAAEIVSALRKVKWSPPPKR